MTRIWILETFIEIKNIIASVNIIDIYKSYSQRNTHLDTEVAPGYAHVPPNPANATSQKSPEA